MRKMGIYTTASMALLMFGLMGNVQAQESGMRRALSRL